MFHFTTSVTRALTAATFLGAVALAGPTYAAAGTETAAPAVMAPSAPAQMAASPRLEKRIAQLHHKLHIAAAQEPQWAAVAQAMRENAVAMDTLVRTRTSNAKTMTAIDDLISYERMAQAHEDGLKRFIPVFQTLYDSMSDGQKKGADAVFRSHGRHHGA